MHWLIELIGVALVLFFLTDIYLTVLFARGGAGWVGDRLGPMTWRAFGLISRPLSPRRRDEVLSLCGPTLLVIMVLVWVLGVMGGFTLIFWPNLGKGILATHGATPTDFISALYVSGSNMTTAGTGDLIPQRPIFRALMTAESLMGISLITLILTYLLQIYNALLRKNVLALSLHHGDSGAADAAALLAGMSRGADLTAAREDLAGLAKDLLNIYESHHFYPALLYFRFCEPYYAVARMALVSIDLATLVCCALDDRQYRWLKESTATKQLWAGTRQLLLDLSRLYLPKMPAEVTDPDDPTRRRWERRFARALEVLQQAGIAAAADDQAAARRYVEMRSQWDNLVMALSRYMAHSPQEIDPISAEAA